MQTTFLSRALALAVLDLVASVAASPRHTRFSDPGLFQHIPDVKIFAAQPLNLPGPRRHVPRAVHQQPITAVPTISRRSAATLGRRDIAANDGQTNATAHFGMDYTVDVEIKNAGTFKLKIDTSASDTWAVQEGYECNNWTRHKVDTAECQMGKLVPASFKFDGGAIDRYHLSRNITSRISIFGPVGYTDLKFGDMNVMAQQIGMVNRTSWVSNNESSGALGLGYPIMGHVFKGSGPEDSDYMNQQIFAPVLTTMAARGLVDTAYFGVALARGSSSSAGVLSWGGMPDVDGLDTSKVAVTKILITQLNKDPVANEEPSYYTIVPDEIKYGLVTESSRHPYIIDTSTGLIHVSKRIAEAVNEQFNPPGQYDPRYNEFYTNCSATVPSFAIVIERVSFWVSPMDMLNRQHPTRIGWCRTAITMTEKTLSPWILGGTFLTNVAVGFDLNAAEIKLVARSRY